MSYMTPRELTDRLSVLRAEGSEASLEEATRLEREAEKAAEKAESKSSTSKSSTSKSSTSKSSTSKDDSGTKADSGTTSGKAGK